MFIVIFIGGFLFCVLPIILAVVIIAKGLKFRRRLEEARSHFVSQDLDKVQRLILEIASAPPSAAVLVRTNQSATDDECLIHIPERLHDFPWAGLTVRVFRDDTASEKQIHSCSFVESDFKEIRIKGHVDKAEYVPRIKLKSGMGQDVDNVGRFMRLSHELCRIMEEAFPQDPEQFISEVFPYTSVFSRIGGDPSWASSSKYPTCSLCDTKMSLIVQLDAKVLNSKTDEHVYFWGCRKHPRATISTAERIHSKKPRKGLE